MGYIGVVTHLYTNLLVTSWNIQVGGYSVSFFGSSLTPLFFGSTPQPPVIQ